MGSVPMRTGKTPTADAWPVADVEPRIRSLDIATALGLPFHDVERGVVVLPKEVVDSINRSYAEVSRRASRPSATSTRSSMPGSPSRAARGLDSGSDRYISGAPRPNGQLHTLHRMPGSAPEIVAPRALS